jgi:hypothetical protein
VLQRKNQRNLPDHNYEYRDEGSIDSITNVR